MVPVDTSPPATLALLCTVLAACCLVLAANLTKRALRPFGALTRVTAAIAGAGMAAGVAIVLVAVALLAR